MDDCSTKQEPASSNHLDVTQEGLAAKFKQSLLWAVD